MALRQRVVAATAAAALTAAALVGIKHDEGYRPYTYLDPVQIPTRCWGNTAPGLRVGQRWTLAQCEAIFAQDIDRHARGVARCLTAPVTRNEFSAIVSFAYNVGVAATCKSTLVRLVNGGQYAAAANEFPKWVYATRPDGTKVVLPGLVERRKRERRLFLSRDPHEPQNASVAALKQPSWRPTWRS